MLFEYELKKRLREISGDIGAADFRVHNLVTGKNVNSIFINQCCQQYPQFVPLRLHCAPL
jgi:hypothetical protein